jgi:hypothetical protein
MGTEFRMGNEGWSRFARVTPMSLIIYMQAGTKKLEEPHYHLNHDYRSREHCEEKFEQK